MVIDNGSTDGSQEFISEHYPEVMLHCVEENLGFVMAAHWMIRRECLVKVGGFSKI